MTSKRRGRGEIKCVGRFSQLRERLTEAIDVVADGDPNWRIINREDLRDIYELVESDLHASDFQDPYYHDGADPLRTDFAEIRDGEPGLGLVPLLTEEVPVESALVEGYVRQFNPKGTIIDRLLLFAADDDKGVERLDRELDIEMSNMYVPCRDGSGCSLSGYKLSAGFGIGPNNPLENLVFDAPFHVELHKMRRPSDPYEARTKESSVMGVGFWLNIDNDLLVGQMQETRGASLPDGAELGITGLTIAEAVGRALGADTVTTYSARTHPQFRMHPDSISQMQPIFKRDLDRSANHLKYSPLTVQNNTGNGENIGFRKSLR